MKKLMIVVSAALIGGAAYASTAGDFPRVYEYKASLTTAVAKNARKVTYAATETTEKETLADICYRTKGKISLKGVFLFECACVENDEWVDDATLLLAMVATSEDKYMHVSLESDDAVTEELDSNFWLVNRLGNPDTLKAKQAEMGFYFEVTPSNSCDRAFGLDHAGFGTAKALDSSAKDSIDVVSISGGAVGEITAAFCSAVQSNCPRCLDSGDCEQAIAFAPCVDDAGNGYGNGTSTDAAYGSFTLKYSDKLSRALYNIPAAEVQETINTLVPMVFGKKAVPPSID